MSLFPRARRGTLLTLAVAIMLFSPGYAPALEQYRAAGKASVHLPEYGPLSTPEASDTLSLSGTWRMKDGDAKWEEVQVPGCWPAGLGEVSLRRTFTLDPTWIGNHHRIVFRGVRPNATVTLNGRLVEVSEGGWPTLVVDLPDDILRFDRANELLVELNDRLSARESIPLKPKLYDVQRWSGIFADVVLVSGPAITVESVDWSTDISRADGVADWRFSCRIRDHSFLREDTLQSREVRVRLLLAAPGESTPIRAGEEVVVRIAPLESAQLNFSGQLRRPRLWTLDSPRLYTATLVVRDEQRQWRLPLKVGFRSFAWDDGRFSLNGEPIELRGIDLRQELPASGIALTFAELEADLARIRKQGFNLVRVVGAVPHPATASICDRLGLLLLSQTGLHGVPHSLLAGAALANQVESLLRRMRAWSGYHASVIGWGLVDWAEPSPEMVAFASSMRERILRGDNRPLFVGFATADAFALPAGIVGMLQREPYSFEQRTTRHTNADGAWLAGGVGAPATPLALAEDSLQSQIRQSEALARQINAVRELPVAGFVIDGFNDRAAALPMLLAGAQSDPSVIRRGLVTADREERIAWQKAGDLLALPRTDVPVSEPFTGRFPVEYPIATLIVGGLLLLVMRQNNVFRANLRRMFAHTHGFFVDIVDRRYFQSGQTFFVALIIAAGQGILLASLLTHSRFDFGLDYLFTLLVPFPDVKAMLVHWAWHPIRGIVAFSLLMLVALALSALVLRIVSIPFPGRFKLRHSLALVVWSATCFLPLLPIGLVYYRLLDYSWFGWIQLVLFVIFWYWYFSRITGVIRVGYRVSLRTAWLLLVLFVLVGAGTLLTLYRSGFAIMDYVRYATDVILPWTGG